MKLTKAWLTKWEACSDGVAWFDNFGKTKSSEVMKGLLKARKLEWANWLIARLLNQRDRVRYAVFAAEQVLDLFEKKYPEDKRPRKAIEAAKAVVRKNNKETRYAAMAAGDDVWAVWSAMAAVGAAWDAAWAAAGAAAWAAAGAAAGAARDAAMAAAYDSMKEKIIRYGLKLHVKGGL